MRSIATSSRLALPFALLLLCIFASPVFAQPKLAIEPAFPKLPAFDRPIFLTFIPDGSDRIVVVEQVGRVYCFENKPDVTKAHLMGDISAEVRAGGEEGLLGLAFHPRFKENHEVFMHFTSRGHGNYVARFKVNEHAKILPESMQLIIAIDEPEGNHNGGMIAFGHDGFLYIALGDGGGGGDHHGPNGNGQNKNTLLGKILRIDVDHTDEGKAYAIPKDNPFVGVPNTRGEIFAYGLRNPWRFSFDRKTGDLWAGDVGQNAWEEVDIVEKGKNYGWNLMEGTHAFRHKNADDTNDELVPPVAEHRHGEGNCVTGGYVYRGKQIADLQGWYVYGDYATALLWTMRMEEGKPTKPHYIARSPAPPSSFGEDESGEVYIVGYSGAMYRVVAGQ